jgi:hypothetical protein
VKLKYLSLATSLLAVVFLNGCLEVEDNNEDVKKLLEQSENRVNIKGVVINALDLKPINNALITVKVGSKELVSNLQVTDGSFEIPGLPEVSDIDIIVSSPDDSFLSRTFFAKTQRGSKDCLVDFGTFSVSEAVDVEISVIDNGTSNALASLEFIAYSHSSDYGYGYPAVNSAAYKYQHVSTFNIDTGIYTITLPKYIETSISANLDSDKDGEVDYVPELDEFLRGRDLYLGAANTKAFSTIYVNEVEEASALEVRLSLVDKAAKPINGAVFYVEDNVVKSSYDELTSQYIISTQIKDMLIIQLPSFSSNEVTYQSSALTIQKLADGNLSISQSGGHNTCCITIPDNGVIDFALSPEIILESETPLKVVLASSEVNQENLGFSVFYSQAIEVALENILLTNPEGFAVVKGNTSTADQIAPGTTMITGGLTFPVTFALSLNDTRLTVAPLSKLTADDSYHFDIKTVMNKATRESTNVNADELTFEVANDLNTTFSVNDIRLDNENYTTNGVAITPTNTAGEAASPSNWNEYANLYFPLSIDTLQALTLRRTSFIRNGVSSAGEDIFNVVTGGVINAATVGVVRLAHNELFVNQSYYRTVIEKSAQPETQKAYRMTTWVGFSDNTSTEQNSMTFEYSLETKTGEILTGNITIPVE